MWKSPWRRGDAEANALGSAVAERRQTAMITITNGWWRIAAALVALGIAAAAIAGIGEPGTGPWWKHAVGTAALVAARS